MVRIARLIGFYLSAIGVQLASGVGLIALLASAALGWKRASLIWLAAPIVGGAVAAHMLFEDVATGGKVVNAMSNFVVELIVYVAICLIGYALGALARRVRRV